MVSLGFGVIFDKPANLTGQTEYYFCFHFRQLSLADQVSDRVHQGVSLVAIKEVNFFEGRLQLLEHLLLQFERRKFRSNGPHPAAVRG